MTLHLHRGRWWPILCPPYVVFLIQQKGFHHRSITYPAAGINLSSVIQQVTRGTIDASSQGFTLYLNQIRGINPVAIWMILRFQISPPVTEGTCLFLSVVLLVNKFHYRLAGSKNYNVHCKTFLYCAMEMTWSWTLLFCVLNTNDIAIKLFIDIYLVIICVYICVSGF